jgi:hypothetical protein
VLRGSVEERVDVIVGVDVALGRAVAVLVGISGMAVTVGFGVEDGLAVMVWATALAIRSGVGVSRAVGRLQDTVTNSNIRVIKRDFRIVSPP